MITCLRCGYRWMPRWKQRRGYNDSVRCAKCRSPYWNKPRVRKISEDRKNPNAPDYTPPLPSNSHSAGAVSSKSKLPSKSALRNHKIALCHHVWDFNFISGRRCVQCGLFVRGGKRKISTRAKGPARVAVVKASTKQRKKRHAKNASAGHV